MKIKCLLKPLFLNFCPSVVHHLLHEVNDPVLVVVAHVAGVEVALGVQHVLLGVQVSGTHLASLDADLPLGQG